MNLFEFYELAKDTLIETRLHQVANFLAEQNDTTSIVTRKYDVIKVNYENSPYFKRNKEFWRDIETPLNKITPKEFTLNPLQSDEDFMQELKFKYDNRFNTEGNRIKNILVTAHIMQLVAKVNQLQHLAIVKHLAIAKRKSKA